MSTLRSLGRVSAALALIAVTSTALAPIAQAGERDRRVSPTTVWGGAGPQGAGFTHGWSPRGSDSYGWSKSYRYNRGYGYGYGSNWRAGNWYKHDRRGYHRRDGNADEIIGGVILGALGLAVISSAMNNNRDDDPVPANRNTGGWVDPDDQQATGPVPPPPVAAPRAALPAGCDTPREYQTKVQIGGRSVDAYGTACRQADGSWRLGPIERTATGEPFDGAPGFSFDDDE